MFISTKMLRYLGILYPGKWYCFVVAVLPSVVIMYLLILIIHNWFQGGPNTVLRVIIEHMLYPIVLDVLYSIFQRYGKVLKIVTFTKNSKYLLIPLN